MGYAKHKKSIFSEKVWSVLLFILISLFYNKENYSYNINDVVALSCIYELILSITNVLFALKYSTL